MSKKQVRFGSFIIDKLIADGGMGVVFQGHHIRQKIPVAIKLIKPPFDTHTISEFMREVEAMAGLDHPGIVMIYDVGLSKIKITVGKTIFPIGSPYLVMEYASRGTLYALRAPFKWVDFYRILISLLDALAHAHARRVIHCDIKPANILLGSYDDPRPQLKLTDFGIAHTLYRRSTQKKLHEGPIGTPCYMAPEQVQNKWRSFGPWTDMYGVGIVAYELITGDVPFDGKLREVLWSHLNEQLPPLKPRIKIPDHIEEWITGMTNRDFKKRYSSASEAARILTKLTSISDLSEEIDREKPLFNTRLPAKNMKKKGVRSSYRTPQLTYSLREDEQRRNTLSRNWIPNEQNKDSALKTFSVLLPSFHFVQTKEKLTSNTLQNKKTTLLSSYQEEISVTSKQNINPIFSIDVNWRQRILPSVPIQLQGAGLELYGLREPRLVGRIKERDLLWNALKSTANLLRPQLVLIEGQRGIGKSRLARWLCERTHELGLANVMYENRANSCSSLRSALRSSLQVAELSNDELFEHIQKQTQALSHSQTISLTQVVISGSDQKPLNQKEILAVQSWLIHNAKQKPLIVWLDDLDLHAVDLHFLLAQKIEKHPILFVTTCSQVSSVRSKFIFPAMDLLRKKADFHISLQPLLEQDTKDLLNRHLSLLPSFRKKLIFQSEGIAEVTLQLLGHWIETQELFATKEGFSCKKDTSFHCPISLLSYFRQDLITLANFMATPRTKVWRFFTSLAALGETFSESQKNTAIKDDKKHFEIFNLLLQTNLILEEDKIYRFCHSFVRESIFSKRKEIV